MRSCDELRPVTAGRLLEIWKMCRDACEDPLERTLRCNARILAECCFFRGEAVYAGEGEVLDDLPGREMERRLARLADGGGKLSGQALEPAENPEFDPARFDALGKV